MYGYRMLFLVFPLLVQWTNAEQSLVRFSFLYAIYYQSNLLRFSVMFKAFQIAVSWMNIRISIDKVNSELLETDEPYVMIANHQAALDVFSEQN